MRFLADNNGVFITLYLFFKQIEFIVPCDPWWRSWLRYCATSRKVAGSIPDGVIAIFH